MQREIYIAGYPASVGGANTEMLHNVALFREKGVDVHLVSMFPLACAEPAMRALADELGCVSHDYERGIFRNKIVASWNLGRFLCYLPEIIQDGRPKLVAWANCMTTASMIELKCHAMGWIDRFAFVSHYQRNLLLPALKAIRPVNELEGYRPHYSLDPRLQGIQYRYRPPGEDFVLGRISRDDPSKFSPDTWKIFRDVGTCRYRKRVVMLGFGERTARAIGNPPGGCYELYAPGQISAAEFYGRVHCVIHKTGGSRESYCRIVPECYAAGVPIIVERDFAFPELIVDGETGFMCSSSADMSAIATELARYEDRRRNIIEAGYEYLKTEFSLSSKSWACWENII